MIAPRTAIITNKVVSLSEQVHLNPVEGNKVLHN